MRGLLKGCLWGGGLLALLQGGLWWGAGVWVFTSWRGQAVHAWPVDAVTGERVTEWSLVRNPRDGMAPLRQTPYDCGGYVLHYALGLLGRGTPLEQTVALNREKMLPEIGVTPETMVRSLGELGVGAAARTYRGMSDEQATNTWRALLQMNHPVVLLVERHGYWHYVLLTGYTAGGFDLYDPMLPRAVAGGAQTVDRNGARPGNDTLTDEQLLALWDKVSVGGLYERMSVVLHPHEE